MRIARQNGKKLNNMRALMRNKAARENRTVTLRTVAEETRLSYSTVQRYASGNIEFLNEAVLKTLFGYFGCRFEDFFIFEDETKGEEP